MMVLLKCNILSDIKAIPNNFDELLNEINELENQAKEFLNKNNDVLIETCVLKTRLRELIRISIDESLAMYSE